MRQHSTRDQLDFEAASTQQLHVLQSAAGQLRTAWQLCMASGHRSFVWASLQPGFALGSTVLSEFSGSFSERPSND